MLYQAGTEVGSTADVTLVGMGKTAEDVGVVHGDISLDGYLLCCSLLRP